MSSPSRSGDRSYDFLFFLLRLPSSPAQPLFEGKHATRWLVDSWVRGLGHLPPPAQAHAQPAQAQAQAQPPPE